LTSLQKSKQRIPRVYTHSAHNSRDRLFSPKGFSMTYKICLLPGDGIGPEVIAAAQAVLTAIPLKIEFSRADIGFGAYQKRGTPLPYETLEAIRRADAALFGAVTTPPNIPGYFSPVVRMRQELDLYANIRPCRSFSHPISRPGIDLTIVRENTEGLYMGCERVEDDGNRAITERIITRAGSERIIRKAFEISQKDQRHQLTVVHKANVLRQTCGLFRQVALEIAPEYPDVKMREMLIDTCAMELIRAPEHFSVIVTTNLFGDILSDEAAMLIGGLGVAYSGNIGLQAAVFEPVHGSAPDIAGTGQANPAATVLAVAMMLDHLGESKSAVKIRQAVFETIILNKVTPDMGGNLTTLEMSSQIIENLPK
jgi:homoisocitrate dehydrogenase